MNGSARAAHWSRRQFSSTTINARNNFAMSTEYENQKFQGNTPQKQQDEQRKAKPSKLTRDIRTRTILSLIQPTGIPHLGNYLGALRQWKTFQDEKTSVHKRHRRNHQLLYGIADLHALTLRQDRDERKLNVRQTFASLLAIGLDPRHSILFVQSQIQEHAELMWVLSMEGQDRSAIQSDLGGSGREVP